MPEEKKCPFNEKLTCENCLLFKSVAGQNAECAITATARMLFMLYAKAAADSVPGRH